MKTFLLAGTMVAAALALGCAAQKPATTHLGTSPNFPRFKGAGDFFRSFHRVTGIMWGKKLDGQPVNMTWISPRFREKICLTVTINNHCGGG